MLGGGQLLLFLAQLLQLLVIVALEFLHLHLQLVTCCQLCIQLMHIGKGNNRDCLRTLCDGINGYYHKCSSSAAVSSIPPHINF